MDEIERAANPAYSGDDVQPAEDRTCGFSEYKFHGVRLPLLSSRQNHAKPQWQNRPKQSKLSAVPSL